MGNAFEIFAWLFALVLSVTVHEAAHGWVAWRRGDPTAMMLGRVTLNPVKHVDPVGSIILPAILIFLHAPVFGWAKPVPVRERLLKKPRLDFLLVSAAGVSANLCLALLAGGVLRVIM